MSQIVFFLSFVPYFFCFENFIFQFSENSKFSKIHLFHDRRRKLNLDRKKHELKVFFSVNDQSTQQRSDLIDGILKTEISSLNLSHKHNRLAVHVDRMGFSLSFSLCYASIFIETIIHVDNIHTDLPPMCFNFGFMCLKIYNEVYVDVDCKSERERQQLYVNQSYGVFFGSRQRASERAHTSPLNASERELVERKPQQPKIHLFKQMPRNC